MTRDPRAARPLGIKDMARVLGISTGTVDRALHGKPGVSARTKARVLHMAKAIGYRPNLAARHLQSQRAARISVHLPRELARFWDSLRDGIREAAAPFGPSLRVEFRDYPRLGEGDAELFEAALADGTDGLIVAPGDPAALAPWLDRAAHLGVPVVCVVTDAPQAPRLASVSADPFTVGAVAGEFLGRALPAGGDVAFVTGWLGTQDHAEKHRGFEASVQLAGGALRLSAVVEAHDDEGEGHRQTLALLESQPDLRGIYVSTVNSLPVLRAVERAGRLDRLTIVTTDLFDELVPWLRAGHVAATLYQRPISQGRRALQAMALQVLERRAPAPRIRVAPHLVLRSHLDLFLERLGIGAAAAAP